MSEPKIEISSATFDILERMAKAHPELAGGYARATAGVDIDLVVAVFANALHDGRRQAMHDFRLQALDEIEAGLPERGTAMDGRDEKWAQDIAVRVSVDVCEIERDSPDDDPGACVVYAPEIVTMVRKRILEALPVAQRIPSGGDQAFAHWRDSLPKTHWARYDLSACQLGFGAGIELAAAWVDQRCSDYVAEHGTYDGSTGQTEFSSAGEEYVGELAEIAEGLRALGAKS